MQDEEQNIKLTDKQRRFVEQYCIHFNGALAAREAGYSEDTCKEIASENLTKPNIKDAVSQRLKELTMSADEATKRLTDMARGSIEPFLTINDDGSTTIDLSTDESKKNLGLIKKIKQTKRSIGDTEIIEVYNEIELHDQKDALINILKLHGKFVNKTDVTSGGEKIKTVTVFELPSSGRNSNK